MINGPWTSTALESKKQHQLRKLKLYFKIKGRDLEPGREGGTWLAIGTRNTIKVGALLNVTGEIKQKNCIGRGPIVTNYVTGDWSNEDYCRQLIDSDDIYNAFNFVSVEFK